MSGLSVIVPTRNRSPQLRQFLTALSVQTLDRSRFEVVVVDNGSTDDTSGVVETLRATALYPLRVVSEPRPGLHHARHAGAKAAQFDSLVYADDDVIPFDSWLAALDEIFSTSGAVLVGGKVLPRWEVAPPVWLERLWNESRMIPFLSVIDPGEDAKPIDPVFVWGCNFAIRKSVLWEAGGFHPDAMPEELLRFRGDGESHVSAFVAGKGYTAFYHPAASVWHSVPVSRMTLEYLKKRAFAQGVSDSFAALRARRDASPAPPGVVARLVRFAPARALLRLLLPQQRYVSALLAGAQQEGFAWHQQLFANDAGVRAWVLRSDYLDD